MRHDGKHPPTPTHTRTCTVVSHEHERAVLFHLLLLVVSSGSAEQMFWEVMRLRREMTTARLGFYTADQG